ncbi:MAG: GldG family protein [Alphaproteobacteria bacterium]
MTRRGAALLSILLLIVSFIALNVASSALFRSVHLDLTANQLYTLSPGTKRLLSKLREPITLRLYFSEKLSADYQQINSYGQRVRDLLQQFADYAHGNLILNFVDPEPYSPEEEMAEAYGLTGAQTESGERVFLGLVGTNQVDGKEDIPFFSPDREIYVEYDLASLISRLATPDKPKLGVITSLPLEMGPGGYMAVLQGQQPNPYVIYTQLKQNFDVQVLDKDLRVIPEGIQTLLIAHPVGLTAQTLYAIDQFALKGGRLIVLVDPYSETSAGQSMGGQQPPGSATVSDLKPLLANWGVDYDPGSVVLDRQRAVPVQFGQGDQGAVLPYYAWLRLTGKDINRKDLITGDIDTIQLASAGSLTPAKGATTKFEPLLTSSTDAQKTQSMVLQFGGDPQSLMNSFKSDYKSYVIAARVSGPIKTAYPDGPPPEPAKPADDKNANGETKPATPPEPLPPQIKEGKSPLNLIIVADADLLEDRFWVNVQDFLGQKVAQPTAGNGFFIVNAVDHLMGSDDLISLRSRSRSDRPFTVVQAIERRAQDRYRAQQQELQAKVDDTEQRLKELQRASPKPAGSLVEEDKSTGPVLSAAQEQEMHKFEAELIKTRRALREVQRELRADVITLGDWVKFLNIAFMPIVVAIGAVLLAMARRRRRIAARQAAAKSGAM